MLHGRVRAAARVTSVHALDLHLTAHNWQQKATQAPVCALLSSASSLKQGWIVRQLKEGSGGPSLLPKPRHAKAALNS